MSAKRIVIVVMREFWRDIVELVARKWRLMQFTTDGLAHLFGSEFPAVRLMRNCGNELTESITSPKTKTHFPCDGEVRIKLSVGFALL